MAIRTFKCVHTETFFKTGKPPRKIGWSNIHRIAKRKLDMLYYDKDIKDLLSPPSNKLESLQGHLKGHYSIRINDQWRVIFR